MYTVDDLLFQIVIFNSYAKLSESIIRIYLGHVDPFGGIRRWMARMRNEDATQSSNIGIAIVAKKTRHHFARKCIFLAINMRQALGHVKDAESAQQSIFCSTTSNR